MLLVQFAACLFPVYCSTCYCTTSTKAAYACNSSNDSATTYTHVNGTVSNAHVVARPQVALQCFIVWLLYFYCSMALRENVLQVNGSNIRPWWIQHHYWSIFTCFLFLTIPIDSPGALYIDMFMVPMYDGDAVHNSAGQVHSPPADVDGAAIRRHAAAKQA